MNSISAFEALWVAIVAEIKPIWWAIILGALGVIILSEVKKWELKRNATSAPTWGQYFCWWISGTNKEIMTPCSDRAQMAGTALGLVFILNYAILLGIWCDVGNKYLKISWLGEMPWLGLLVPSVFIALDRIIAMRYRPLTGSLDRFDIGEKNNDMLMPSRIFMAAALSLMTTFTFQLEKADSLIVEKNEKEKIVKNEELRKDINTKLAAACQNNLENYNNDIKSKQKDVDDNYRKLMDARTAEQTAITNYLAASKSKADLEQRFYDPTDQSQVRSRNQTRSTFNGSMRVANAEKVSKGNQVKEFEAEDKKLRGELASLQARGPAVANCVAKLTEVDEKNPSAGTLLDAKVKADERYYKGRTRGLFSDASTFLSLFSDPDVSSGVLIMTVLTFLVFMALELSALLAIHLLPLTDYDVALVYSLRAQAISRKQEQGDNNGSNHDG